MSTPPNILDMSKEILRRLIAAAEAEERAGKDWRADDLHSDPEAGERAIAAYTKACEAYQPVKECEDLLENSYTEEQLQLRATRDHARQEMQILGEEHYLAAKAAFENSLTAQQREWIEQIDRLSKPLGPWVTTVDRYQHNIRFPLTCSMPQGIKKYEARIVSDILSGAINLCLHQREYDITWGEDEAGVCCHTDDRRFVLRLSGHPKIELGEVERVLREKVPAILSNPANWERVKTKKGTGYRIIGEFDKHGIVLNIVNGLIHKPSYKTDSNRSFKVDGAPVTTKEFWAARDTSPKSRFEREIILTGKAADDILAMMGVDKLKIKDAPRQRGA